MENSYWHICTDGLSREIIFKSEDDFIFGMNGVPVYSFHFDVRIMAFCLMSNHVHFITYGSGTGCKGFIRGYRKRLSCLTDMHAASVSIKLIDDTDYLMKAIGYVLRNPVGAGEKVLPTTYRWGSGHCTSMTPALYAELPSQPSARIRDRSSSAPIWRFPNTASLPRKGWSTRAAT